MSATDSRRRIVRGFTLVELLVVIAIIILLIGILLPALNSARDRAKKTAVQIQLESIADACESYHFEYSAYPGYFTDAEIADTIGAEFSNNENLVISLMGYVQTSNTGYVPTGSSMPTTSPDYKSINIDKIGDGPLTRQGAAHSPFYSPSSRELFAIPDDGGSEPLMPEIVDNWKGIPILYYRANPRGTKPVSETSAGGGTYYRNANKKYFNRAALTNQKEDQYIQSQVSLISNTGAGSATTADNNMSWIVANRKLTTLSAENSSFPIHPSNDANGTGDVAKGGFVLIAAGKDGTYFDKDALSAGTYIDAYEDVDELDDIIVFGGNR
ncbi:MAG: prepilin-type N-terminal cleavage/methylation domain-containing protein [Phycisphaera sp.]|nr:prepilin-type N-terminal cleavage/methylation domain-containing protein [Phycisphaera sp.]